MSVDEKLHEPPAILYKYFPPERIDVLENLQVRFSRPSEFNDTFDSHFLVPKSEGSKAIANRFRLRQGLGVLCLTETPNNHLMWVNYARNHTGFVLGFDARASFFRDDNRILRHVDYCPRPQVAPSANLDACFDKSEDWSYEREWRCAREFDSSESRMVDFRPDLITEIVFGWKMEDWQIARIMSYADGYEMRGVRFFHSRPSHKSWVFEKVPEHLSLCPSCNGEGYVVNDPGSE